nr:U-box domain-containing protein 52-like isoform X2 [Ipomoea batatas]
MWLQSSKPNGGAGHKAPAPASRGLVAIAVDKDKGSQSALKWTTENLVSRGQTLVLIHIQTMDIILEDTDVSKALMQYVSGAAIENLVLGASKHGLLKLSPRRLKVMDVPTCVSKGAPDFCTVYVISKAKISSVRNASRPAPFMSPLYNQINKKNEEQQDNSPPTATAAPVVPKVNAAATPSVTRHRHTPTLKG